MANVVAHSFKRWGRKLREKTEEEGDVNRRVVASSSRCEYRVERGVGCIADGSSKQQLPSREGRDEKKRVVVSDTIAEPREVRREIDALWMAV